MLLINKDEDKEVSIGFVNKDNIGDRSWALAEQKSWLQATETDSD